MEVTYRSVDSLAGIVKKKGVGCLLYKRDLRRAYIGRSQWTPGIDTFWDFLGEITFL